MNDKEEKRSDKEERKSDKEERSSDKSMCQCCPYMQQDPCMMQNMYMGPNMMQHSMMGQMYQPMGCPTGSDDESDDSNYRAYHDGEFHNGGHQDGGYNRPQYQHHNFYSYYPFYPYQPFYPFKPYYPDHHHNYRNNL